MNLRIVSGEIVIASIEAMYKNTGAKLIEVLMENDRLWSKLVKFHRTSIYP